MLRILLPTSAGSASPDRADEEALHRPDTNTSPFFSLPLITQIKNQQTSQAITLRQHSFHDVEYGRAEGCCTAIRRTGVKDLNAVEGGLGLVALGDLWQEKMGRRAESERFPVGKNEDKVFFFALGGQRRDDDNYTG